MSSAVSTTMKRLMPSTPTVQRTPSVLHPGMVRDELVAGVAGLELGQQVRGEAEGRDARRVAAPLRRTPGAVAGMHNTTSAPMAGSRISAVRTGKSTITPRPPG